MALVRKNINTSQSVSKKQIVKVNPYENPENVMNLMAKICSATPSVDTTAFSNVVKEAYNKVINGMSLRTFIKDHKHDLDNVYFFLDLKQYCKQISENLTTRENSQHTQVVVAGGFSSGKSSFLNRLTQCGNLLPTGVEPVSVVKTYLYCSKNTKNVAVKGVNPKNVLVNLDTTVLQAIQHAKQSNVYLASVLDKLFVEIPSQNLDGLVFIDTPGYNNSDSANKSNGKTDRQTAIEALSEGNVLFWLVDCERGTTVTADLDIIKKFEGKKVFIFNKADKKGESESKKIIQQATLTLFKEFPRDEIIDILAFSTLDNKIFYSHNNLTMDKIIQLVKSSGNGSTELNNLKEDIAYLFQDEIEASQAQIVEIQKNYRTYQQLKIEAQNKYNNGKEYQIRIVSDLRNCLINSYNYVESIANTYINYNHENIDAFRDFLDNVKDFDRKRVWQDDNLDRYKRQAERATNSAVSKHYNSPYNYNTVSNSNYKPLEVRKRLVDDFNQEENEIVEQYLKFYQERSTNCERLKNDIEKKKDIIDRLEQFKNCFMSALEYGISNYQQKNKATSVEYKTTAIPNVFDSIKRNDYKAFEHSFEDGVDLSICDVDGYNPMTRAIQMGNNMMFQFMLDHGADPSIKDNRGYNAFHTAVENQYRSICKQLLDYDSDLIDTETSKGESVEDLAKRQTFSKWLEKEL